MLSNPLDEKMMDRFDFRADQQPYTRRGLPPSERIRPDYFAIVATSDWGLSTAGEYEIRTLSDDGIRVFIDDEKLVDNWRLRGAMEDKARVTLANGIHKLRVEYFQFDKPARLQFSLRLLRSLNEPPQAGR
jgi:hypothetical protein